MPLSWTTETIGPLARDARTVGLVFGLLRGPDGLDPRAGELPPLPPTGVPADLRGLRIARPGGYLTELCDGAVRAGVDHLVDVLTGAGAEIVAGEIAAQSRATMLGNLTGAPGLALPTGFAPDGCPVSALLIARPHDEITALRVAALFQDRTEHHSRRPPIADRIGDPFPPAYV
ncbi:hypothetical protein [Pseudonocardia sp. NPDC046786]|uniref:hypothetical protein n=1 Tax=Pseudonocardia sp. NPDC046786 TaxID=3155471 RepID=UPI0034051D85